jgi:secreted protein with Ig-like and vWFA domain
VAVLDMSGSMAGPRLALVRETMMFVISQLQPSDRLSIVAFSHMARRAIKLTRATEAGKAQMRAAVQALR